MTPRSDRPVALFVLRSCALGTITILVLIVAFVVGESVDVLRNAGLSRLWTDPTWHPASKTNPTFGAVPMIVGTLFATAGAVVVALPLGLLCAVFVNYHATHTLRRLVNGVIELLAGIPSVVYGLWGLTTLVPIIAMIRGPGTSLLAGILVLALMILPTIVLLIDQALREQPAELALSAAALGLSKSRIIWSVLVPSAWRSIGTASLLATARALGETMAVLLVCGNAIKTPTSLFDSVRTLTANIALEMAYAMDTHRSALFASGLLLLGLVGLLIAGIELLERRVRT